MKAVGLISLMSGIDFSKVYETPTLSGNYDDYLITDLQNYSTIVINASGDVKLRGLDSTNVNPWQFWLIINNSNKKVKCEYNKGSSLAANRFDGDKAFDIKKNCPAILIRNGLTDKFLVIKGN